MNNNHSKKISKYSGFTLIELMVATAVMAILALLSWRGLDNMTQVQSQTQRQTENVMALQTGLAQWQADLDAAWELDEVWNKPQMPTINALDFDGQVLKILRRLTENDVEHLRVVAWAMRGIEGKQHWLRWQSDRLQTREDLLSAWLLASQWAKTPTEDSKKNELVIAAIDKWNLCYIHDQEKTCSNAQSTGNALIPGTTPMKLPKSVTLTLTLSKGQTLEGDITKLWIRPNFGGPP